MTHLNIEIKAHCKKLDEVRQFLQENNADFRGTDYQVDTYFIVPNGRMKLRRGKIENSLIFYDRPNEPGLKRSEVTLYSTDSVGAARLYETLTSALEILVVVNKQREIYFIENVKFHLDTIQDLGSFIEIEAISADGVTEEILYQQCQKYMDSLGINPVDLAQTSYSDMLMEKYA